MPAAVIMGWLQWDGTKQAAFLIIISPILTLILRGTVTAPDTLNDADTSKTEIAARAEANKMRRARVARGELEAASVSAPSVFGDINRPVSWTQTGYVPPAVEQPPKPKRKRPKRKPAATFAVKNPAEIRVVTKAARKR